MLAPIIELVSLLLDPQRHMNRFEPQDLPHKSTPVTNYLHSLKVLNLEHYDELDGFQLEEIAPLLQMPFLEKL
jgi:hypothetical protein